MDNPRFHRGKSVILVYFKVTIEGVTRRRVNEDGVLAIGKRGHIYCVVVTVDLCRNHRVERCQ